MIVIISMAFYAFNFAIVGACIVGEMMYAKSAPELSFLYTPVNKFGFSTPKAYGGVVLVNIVLSFWVILMLGFRVSSARKTFAEAAKKDGDKDADVMFELPKMYAEGYSENAKKFNCVQRGHQQALETYSSFLLFSLLGGIQFPLSTTAAGVWFCWARQQWANGYATGTPGSRYSHAASLGVWMATLMVMLATSIGAVQMFL